MYIFLAAHADKAQSNSEPKLTEDSTPDVSPNIRRKGSQRRGTSVYQRKSTAFLDVPETRKAAASHSNTEGEEDEDSYRLRSFSFTSKGMFTMFIILVEVFFLFIYNFELNKTN